MHANSHYPAEASPVFGARHTSTVPVIVLTGGPGGGKTTLMRELRAEDPECRKWVLVPEAAPLLFRAGLSAREPEFQSAVVRVQMALEDACALAAPPGAVLVCHRGVLDPLAYWLAAGREEGDFFNCVGFSRAEMLDRYAAVVHLQTTAMGAEPFYQRWPEAHRPETIEQAAKIDCHCLQSWQGHRHHSVLENLPGGWSKKAQEARRALGKESNYLEDLERRV